MFRREKNNKLDNEGLRRMREAIRQRLEQEEAAAESNDATLVPSEPSYRPSGGATGGGYAYDTLTTDAGYSYLGEGTGGSPAPERPFDPEGTEGATSASVTPPWRQEAPAQDRTPASPTVTTIAAGTTWSGILKSSAEIRVEGTFDGEIETARTLHVAQSATVKATVRAAIVIVAGHLDGQVECSERLEVLQSGRVSGQITAGAIVVKEGAFLGGQLRMGAPEDFQGNQDRPVLQRVH